MFCGVLQVNKSVVRWRGCIMNWVVCWLCEDDTHFVRECIEYDVEEVRTIIWGLDLAVIEALGKGDPNCSTA